MGIHLDDHHGFIAAVIAKSSCRGTMRAARVFILTASSASVGGFRSQLLRKIGSLVRDRAREACLIGAVVGAIIVSFCYGTCWAGKNGLTVIPSRAFYCGLEAKSTRPRLGIVMSASLGDRRKPPGGGESGALMHTHSRGMRLDPCPGHLHRTRILKGRADA